MKENSQCQSSIYCLARSTLISSYILPRLLQRRFGNPSSMAGSFASLKRSLLPMLHDGNENSAGFPRSSSHKTEQPINQRNNQSQLKSIVYHIRLYHLLKQISTTITNKQLLSKNEVYLPFWRKCTHD